MGNPYAPKKKKIVSTEDTTLNVVEEQEVPDGNIKDLLEWVGEDKDKAQLLFDDENSSDKPRKTLTSALEAIING